MIRRLCTTSIAGLALALAVNAQAATVTMEFTASGFQNQGAQFPGYSGPVTGRISWEQSTPGQAISTLTGIEFNLFGKQFTLNEVAIGSQNSFLSVLGGLVSGVNSVIGNGLADDFVILFDRVNPSISSMAFSLKDKAGALWQSPAVTSARFVTSTPVSEPAPWALALAAGVALVVLRRSQPASPR